MIILNINYIISPYKENNPFQSNFNMASPDNNLRFMDNLGLISSGKKELVDKNFADELFGINL